MATRTLLGAAGLLTCLLLVIPTAARSAARPLSGDEIPEDPAQPPEGPPEQPPEGSAEQPPEGPPEQPPEGPPEQPPGEEEETGEVTQPPAEEPPLTDETAATGPAGEEATGEASEGADEETEGESEESEGRAPEIATAPVGILPGGLLAAPAPVPGTAIVGMVFADDGFLLHMAGGEVIAYERDGEATRWGLPGADATFVAQDSGSVVLLDERGDVTLRRFADGVRVGGFSTGLKPDAGMVAGAGPGAGRGPAAATLFGGVLYWVSAGTLHGYRISAGNAVVEVALPDGEAASVVAAASATAESAGNVPPLLLVSLGSGGVAAVSPSGGTTSGALRWHAEGAGPVTGPVLALSEERLAIFGDEGGDLTAVDLDSGKPRWRWRLAEGFHHPPLLSRGRLYAATKANSLYCFDAKRGGERWRTALPGRPAAPPLRIAGAVLVVTQDGLLVELNAETGARIGRPHDLGVEVVGVVRRRGDAAREDGWRDRRLFLGLRDGRLAVFGPRASRGGP